MGPTGVDFASLDGETVNLFFLLISPPDRPGDQPRHVHWKAAARSTHGDPPVKIFAGSAAGEMVFTYADTVGDMEVRLSQLALWVEEATVAGLRFGLELPGAVIRPDTGADHRIACLRLLARWHGGGGR